MLKTSSFITTKFHLTFNLKMIFQFENKLLNWYFLPDHIKSMIDSFFIIDFSTVIESRFVLFFILILTSIFNLGKEDCRGWGKTYTAELSLFLSCLP